MSNYFEEDFSERSRPPSSKGGGGRRVESDLDQLVRDGDWEELKYNEEFQGLSVEKQILTAKEAVNNRLGQADKIFKEAIRDDLESARIIVEKRIKPLKNLIKALNARFAGSLSEEDAERMKKMLGIMPPGSRT